MESELPLSHPPTLRPSAQCNSSLRFDKTAHWPQALPAVAINTVIIGGFDQPFVFDYEVGDFSTTLAQEKSADIFKSIHQELSFAEATELSLNVKKHLPRFPLAAILKAYGYELDESFESLAKLLETQPQSFKDWIKDKKLRQSELQILKIAASKDRDLAIIGQKISDLRMTKSEGTLALELASELLMMGKNFGADQQSADSWLGLLKKARYPETSQADKKNEDKWKNFAIPGTSQAKWVRQGDKAGLELKLFVSNPSDIKKYLNSLKEIQELMEQDLQTKKTEH